MASTASRYSGNVVQSHEMPCSSAARLMPSTRSSMRMMRSRPDGAHGASVKPQLPMTTVVTPCQEEHEASGSQVICAS